MTLSPFQQHVLNQNVKNHVYSPICWMTKPPLCCCPRGADIRSSKLLFLLTPDQFIIRFLRIMRKDSYILSERQYSSEKIAIENWSEGQFPAKGHIH